MAHYWLALFLMLAVLKTFRVIVKSIARIWWRPIPGEARDDEIEEAEPPPVSLNTDESNVPEPPPAAVQVHVAPRRERRTPEKTRRSVWDRLMED